MALRRELIVKQDLNLGYGSATVTTDSGGSQTGSKIGIHTLIGSSYNARDFGVRGDGTDEREAIATALSAARGGTLIFPDGRYRINTDGGSLTTEEVNIVGSGVLDGSSDSIDQGTVFEIVGTTNSPFSVRRGSQFRGLGFYYPNQTDSASPVAYPPTLNFDYTGSGGSVQYVYVDRCVAYNAYRFINISNQATGHCWFTNNTIYGIHRCIEIADNAEIIKILGNTFTFGHWLDATEAGIRSYTRANGVAVQYDEGDGIHLQGNLIFGYLRGVDISGAQVLQLNMDGNFLDQVRYGVHVRSTGNLNQSVISNNSFFAFNNNDLTQEGIAVYLQGASSGGLNINGNYFAQATSDHINIAESGGGIISVTGNVMEYPAHSRSSGSYACVRLNASSKSLHMAGNTCYGQTNAFASGVILTTGTAANITGNTFALMNNAVKCVAMIDLAMTGNLSRGTVASSAYDLAGVSGNLINTDNIWDKQAGYGITALANDATPSVAITAYDHGNHRYFRSGGTTTITDFDDGWEGLIITLIAEHAVTITDGTNIFLSGSANFAMAATDTLTLIQKADGFWYEIARSDNT